MLADYQQQEFRHTIQRRVIHWLEEETGLTFTETSSYRTGDGGVHGTLPLRGIDLRCRNQAVGEAIVKLINEHWSYDFERPALMVAVLHGVGRNLHIHIQVHNNTR